VQVPQRGELGAVPA